MLEKASLVKNNEDTGGIGEDEGSLAIVMAPGGSYKKRQAEIDSEEKNPSLGFSGKGSIQEFSFKGSNMESSIDKERDITFSNALNRVNDSERLVRSVTPNSKPSSFLLEKRNSEKNIFPKKSKATSVNPEREQRSIENSDKIEPAVFFHSSTSENFRGIDCSKRSQKASLGYTDATIQLPSSIFSEKIQKHLLNVEESNTEKTRSAKEDPTQIQQNPNEDINKADHNSQGVKTGSLEVIREERVQSHYNHIAAMNENTRHENHSLKLLNDSVTETSCLPPHQNLKSNSFPNEASDQLGKPAKIDPTGLLKKDDTPLNVEQKFTTNLLDLMKKNYISKHIKDPKAPNNTDPSHDHLKKDDISPKGIILSQSKSELSPRTPSMRQNLIMLAREENNNELREIKEQLKSIIIEAPLNINLDFLGDQDGPSQIYGNPGGGHFTPVTHINSSLSKSLQRHLGDNSYFDRTTYHVDENNISKLELDKYSFYADIKNVEFDGKENHGNDSLNNEKNQHIQGLISFRKSLFGDQKNYLRSKTSNLEENLNKEVPRNHDSVLQDQYKSPTGSIDINSKGVNIGDANISPNNISEAQGLKPETSSNQPSSLSNVSNSSATKRQGFIRQQSLFAAATFHRTNSGVVETQHLDKTVDDSGQKKINQYVLIKTLGLGGFGKVKLALNTDNNKEYVRIIALF